MPNYLFYTLFATFKQPIENALAILFTRNKQKMELGDGCMTFRDLA